MTGHCGPFSGNLRFEYHEICAPPPPPPPGYSQCTLRHAFDASNLMSLVFKIVKGNYPAIPDRFPPHVHDLVHALLNKDPAQRPDVGTILSMPEIKDRLAAYVEREEDGIAEVRLTKKKTKKVVKRKTAASASANGRSNGGRTAGQVTLNVNAPSPRRSTAGLAGGKKKKASTASAASASAAPSSAASATAATDASATGEGTRGSDMKVVGNVSGDAGATTGLPADAAAVAAAVPTRKGSVRTGRAPLVPSAAQPDSAAAGSADSGTPSSGAKGSRAHQLQLDPGATGGTSVAAASPRKYASSPFPYSCLRLAYSALLLFPL